MDKKTEEMIAIGVAYGINCIPCLEYHRKKGIEAGLTEEQMRAAILIGMQVKTGAANKTKEVSEELFGTSTEEGCSGCCS